MVGQRSANVIDHVGDHYQRRTRQMNRWLGVFGVMILTVSSTGCLRHQTRSNCNQCSSASTCSSGDCSSGSCSSGNCSSGSCSSGNCGHSKPGLFKAARNHKHGCRGGCQSGPLGWQQGGLNYGANLQPGFGGQQQGNPAFTPGPPTGQVAYPYYSVRGPRDFLMDNPPTIGR